MSRCTFARAATAIAAAATLAGCGERSSLTAPETQAPPVAVPAPDSVSRTANPGSQLPVLTRSAPLANDVAASGTIGGRGGTIALPGTGLYVYFPAGAVNQRTTFTVVASAGALVSYTISPHTVFKVPVALIQDLGYTAARNDPMLAAALQGGYLANGESDIDPKGAGRFAETFSTVLLAGDDHEGRSTSFAVFYTTHFSGYAYASGRSGTPDSY